jgi:hypothetical protein
MRFLLLIFGPFQWNATEDGVRFRWVTNLGLMGGMAATLPVRMDNLRQQLVPMIAGGPLASLGLATLAGLLSVSASGRMAGYAAIVALLSLAIFLATAIPFRAGGFMSDGMQLLEVRRGGTSVIERADLLAVMATSLGGLRPRDWDAALIARLEAMNSAEPLRLLACWVMLLQRAMDFGDANQAAHYAKALAERIDDYPDVFRQSLHIELCLEAALRQDREAAEQHLARTKGGTSRRTRSPRRWWPSPTGRRTAPPDRNSGRPVPRQDPGRDPAAGNHVREEPFWPERKAPPAPPGPRSFGLPPSISPAASATR